MYILSNNVIVTKHHWKKFYLKFYKPVGTIHILDLDHEITTYNNRKSHIKVQYIMDIY